MGDDILSLAAPKADKRVAYAGDGNQFVDLRLASGKGPHPLAISIHGGFWRAKYDLEYMGHMCAALTAKGVTTANLEYRRVGNAGGGWLGTFADIRAAYQFLVQNAGAYEIDVERVAVLGHSAGGQLALCLAAREKKVKGVISLAGVVDLQRAYELHLSNDAVVEFLGGKPDAVPEHYREADPMELSIPQARQWVLHGKDDDVVPPEFSREYGRCKASVKTAPAGKVENVELVEIPRAGHFELIDPASDAFKQVEAAVLAAVA